MLAFVLPWVSRQRVECSWDHSGRHSAISRTARISYVGIQRAPTGLGQPCATTTRRASSKCVLSPAAVCERTYHWARILSMPERCSRKCTMVPAAKDAVSRCWPNTSPHVDEVDLGGADSTASIKPDAFLTLTQTPASRTRAPLRDRGNRGLISHRFILAGCSPPKSRRANASRAARAGSSGLLTHTSRYPAIISCLAVGRRLSCGCAVPVHAVTPVNSRSLVRWFWSPIFYAEGS